MRLNDIAARGVLVFGDTEYRGKCPKEDQEQITFFARLRREYPDTWGMIALHPRNEGLRHGGQLGAVSRHKAEGMTKGAADVIIPARVSFVCELKRRDHTQSQWQDGQEDYLAAVAAAGGFSCVALGCDAAWSALQYWINASAV
jgi:hypothetical protein